MRAALLPLRSLEIDQPWSRSRTRAEVLRLPRTRAEVLRLHLSFKCRCAQPPGLRAQREPLRGLHFSPFRASGNCRDGPARGSLGKGVWGHLGGCVPSLLSSPALAMPSSLWPPLWLSLHLSVLSPVFISPHLPFCHCAISCLSPSLTSCCLSLCICLIPLLFLSLLSVSFPRPPALLCLGGLHLSLSVSVPRGLLPLAHSGG